MRAIMASMSAIDTHKIVKRLREAGFSEPQAEAVTAAVQEAAAVDLSDLVTKTDLNVTKTDLKTELNVTKAEFKADLAETKAELLKWMIGMIAGALMVNILAML